MTISRQNLKFVTASARAFLDALADLPGSQTALLIGKGALAEALAALAAAEGLELNVSPEIPHAEELTQNRIIVFTEQDGEQLGKLLLKCLDLIDVSVIAPVTTWHFSHMPLFIVSIPKAGTHLVYELAQALGYAPGVALPDFPKPQTWYCVEYSNSHTVARDFFVDTVRRAPFGNRHHLVARSPVLFSYRHPFDILVSEAHYYHRNGKTAFAGYFDGLDFDARVRRLMDDEWLLGSLRQRVGGFLPWLDFPNVIPASFEELVGDSGGGSTAAQHRLIWSIMLKLQVDGCVAEVAEKVFNKGSATFREGKIGAWRSELSPSQVEYLAENCGDILAAFGYSFKTDANLLPVAAWQRAGRPLRYIFEDFDVMPITIVSDYMGCNLVRYDKRFYAVPLSAGSVAIDHLSDEQRARLPVADTLSNLKSILLIGLKAYHRQRAQISRAGNALASSGESLMFWKETDTPCIFDEYKDYNLIAWQSRYIALRQSIGPVDLKKDILGTMACYSHGDILVSHDIDELISHIDGTSPAMRLSSDMAKLEAEFIHRIASLDSNLAHMASDMAKREAEFAHRIASLDSNLAHMASDMAKREAEFAHRIASLDSNLVHMASDMAKREAEFAHRIASLDSNLVHMASDMAKRKAEFAHRMESLDSNVFVRLGRFMAGFLWRRR